MKKIKLADYIKKSGDQLSLTAGERAHMERVLSEYVRMKPLRNIPLSRQKPVAHFFLSVYAFSRKSVALVLMGALLLSGAGASYAAETAVPGDILYPLKVKVNEPIVALVSVTDEAKTKWNAERAERRLEETATLLAANMLDDETESRLAAEFEKHADDATNGIVKLEDSESPAAFEIASRLETRLAAHEVVLRSAGSGSDMSSMRNKVREKTRALLALRTKAEGGEAPATVAAALPVPEESVALMSVTADTVALKSAEAGASVGEERLAAPQLAVKKTVVDRLAKSAKKELESAVKLLGRVKEKLDADSRTRVENELSAGTNALSEGDAARAVNDLGAAYQAYRESLSVSEELAVFLKAFNKSRIKTIPEIHASVRGDASPELPHEGENEDAMEDMHDAPAAGNDSGDDDDRDKDLRERIKSGL